MTEGTISYTYDATGSLAQANPLRYRSYYYDYETGFYYLNSRYYDPKTGRFINADSYVSTGQGITGYNMFAYCGNNPVNGVDPTGEFGLVAKLGNSGLIQKIIKLFLKPTADFAEDMVMYDKDNTDIDKVYSSTYFSSYNNVMVIRHSTEYLTSWSINKMIVLNHDLDEKSLDYKTDMLKHEYGHVLQEMELGTPKYIGKIFVPSTVTNLLSRVSLEIHQNYYNMPWEYDADIKGGSSRSHADWAGIISKIYFSIWR